MRLKSIALMVACAAMVVGIPCLILLAFGLPMVGRNILVGVGACVGILGMVGAVAIIESRPKKSKSA